jgi:hypothetical protein
MTKHGLAAMICATLLVCCAGAVAAPSLELVETDKPTPGEAKQIQEYVQQQVAAVLSAKDDAAAADAARTLAKGFARHDTPAFHSLYASAVAQQAPEAIKNLVAAKNTPRLVALCEAIASMNDGALFPLFADMTKAPQEVVRYLGWRGIATARLSILASGQAKPLLDLIKQRAAAETAPVVLSGMLIAVKFPPVSVGAVTTEALAKVNAEVLDALPPAWDRLCAAAAGGDEEASNALRTGLSTVGALALTVAREGAAKTKVLQMVFNAMDAGSQSLRAAVKDDDSLMNANLTLVLEAEAVIANITGAKERHVYDATVKNRNPADRAREVRLATLKWLDQLKQAGVAEQKFAAPTSAPATTATAPAANP